MTLCLLGKNKHTKFFVVTFILNMVYVRVPLSLVFSLKFPESYNIKYNKCQAGGYAVGVLSVLFQYEIFENFQFLMFV